MSDSESTAINDLIDLVKRKPLELHAGEDLLFEGPRAARLGRGTSSPSFSTLATPRSRATPAQAPVSEQDLKTVYVARHVPLGQTLKRLALPIAGFLIAGVAIGVVASIGSERQERHVDAPAVTAPLSVAAPAPITPTPIVTAVVTPIVTPVVATPTLDPGASNHVEVALVEPTPSPAPRAVAKAPARHLHRHAAQKQAARVAVAPARSPLPGAPVQAVAATGNGMLMVTTTPPCAILIDGKNTGLTSPQSAISLPAGNHNVRLIAATAHVNKLVAVEITPRHTTKLVQTF